MKTLFFKSSTDGISLPNIELSQPRQPGRPRWNIAIFRIRNVPDETDWREVKRLFEGTIIPSMDLLEIDYASLGIGKIILNDGSNANK